MFKNKKLQHSDLKPEYNFDTNIINDFDSFFLSYFKNESPVVSVFLFSFFFFLEKTIHD